MKRARNPARPRLTPTVPAPPAPAARSGLFALALLLWAPAALAQGMLGNPQDAGQESGIGIVSGWHCDADAITVQFDAYDPLEASYGTSREDTVSTCGDADNGFAMLWNWNLLGPGPHTVRVFADGMEFDSATFEVNTLGEEFVRGLDLRTELTALDLEKNIEIRWSDSRQGFVISEVREADITVAAILAVLGGTWSGTWSSPTATGPASMTFAGDGMGGIVVTDISLSGTGCAAHGTGVGSGIDINDPFVEVLMDDGSIVEVGFMVTESFSAVGGTFWFASGACADTDGFYHLFRD
jgi:hypothetical protein